MRHFLALAWAIVICAPRDRHSLTAKLAVGYLLDELKNDITRETPASFEPSIDYVVTKIPRFASEKFPQAARRSVRSEIFVATRAAQFSVPIPSSSDFDVASGAAQPLQAATMLLLTALETSFDFGCYNHAAPDGAPVCESHRHSNPAADPRRISCFNPPPPRQNL